MPQMPGQPGATPPPPPGTGQAPGSTPAAPTPPPAAPPTPPPAPPAGTGQPTGFGPTGTAAQAPAAYGQPAWGAETTDRPRSALRPLAIIGAIGIILGGPLPWSQFHFEAAGYNLLFKFLFTGKPQDLVNGVSPSFDIASIGVALIVLGVIALILSFVPTAHVIRRVAGLLAVLIVVAFVVQLMVGDINESFGGLFKDLGPGAYTAFVGGILALVG